MTSRCRRWAGSGSETHGGMARGRANRMDGNIRWFKEGIADQESVVAVQAKGGQILIKEGEVECNSGVGATGCYQSRVGLGERVCVDTPSWNRLDWSV